jgi:hypothetical protein
MRPLGSFVAGSPAGVPACLGMGILVAWAVADGGYAVPTWVPGGLALLGLLAVGLAVAPQRPAELPRTLVVALGALGAFTLWSYASMLWADDPAVTRRRRAPPATAEDLAGHPAPARGPAPPVRPPGPAWRPARRAWRRRARPRGVAHVALQASATTT